VVLSRLERPELLAVAGGLVLAISVFLTWYTTGNIHGNIDGRRGDVSAWNALQVMRFLLLAAAAAPIVLAYIVVRGHALSWPRGELTAVIGVTAFVLILMRGLIIKPGEPSGEISLAYGYVVAVLGALLMVSGALAHRAEHDPTPRKPPGVM
jgi:hypothetical protein